MDWTTLLVIINAGDSVLGVGLLIWAIWFHRNGKG